MKGKWYSLVVNIRISLKGDLEGVGNRILRLLSGGGKEV
jgi:hypothetical protein